MMAAQRRDVINRGQISHFWPPSCKSYGRDGETSRYFSAVAEPLVFIWWAVAVLSGCTKVRLKIKKIINSQT